MRGHIAYVRNDPVEAYKDGYAAGLEHAREAVASMNLPPNGPAAGLRAEAIAAIDDLREGEAMTDHLPECLHDDATYGLHGLCICTEIERAIDRVLNLNAVALGVLIAQRARERALDAAREAVSKIPKEDGGYCHVLHACDVEAAIDALKEKP